MAVEFSLDEARDRLTELLDRAEAGEDVVITRSGAPAFVLERVPAGPDLASPLGTAPVKAFDMGTDYGLHPVS
ncbi:type II toxin-antitoxin system Phd/YefM family antitoxin [Saccharopolyspora griseoalba]|uniref:Antitoxin n=1 Tax=Saccharopolyspora griseoalba TaxID=1431848 RepID=A0ABW2LGI4_9PSEU